MMMMLDYYGDDGDNDGDDDDYFDDAYDETSMDVKKVSMDDYATRTMKMKFNVRCVH